MRSSASWRAAARLVLVAALAWATGAGCGRTDAVYPVKGRVTVNGQPLQAAGGGVAFIPDKDKGNNTPHEPRGALTPDGTYELTTAGKPGAPPGWYKVLVLAQAESPAGNPYAPPKYVVPVSYTKAEQTPVSVEVVAKPGPNAYDIDVVRK